MNVPVITYQYAYDSSRTISLCVNHTERQERTHKRTILGPVSHGLHAGVCDECAAQQEAGLYPVFYVLSFRGDRYASRTIDGALYLAGVDRDDDRGTHIAYHYTVIAPDAGAARLLGAQYMTGNCYEIRVNPW